MQFLWRVVEGRVTIPFPAQANMHKNILGSDVFRGLLTLISHHHVNTILFLLHDIESIIQNLFHYKKSSQFINLIAQQSS